MKKTICLPLLLFFALSLLASKGEPRYPVAKIPADLLKNAHTVVREERYSIDIKSIRDYEVKHYYAVTLLNEKSKADQFGDTYDKHSKVTRLKAKIYDANGKLVREVKKNEIKDVSAVASYSIYEDDRIKYIEVSYKQYPYTIVFESTKSYKGTLTYPNWQIQGLRTSVQQASFSVTTAKGVDIQHAVKNIELETVVQEEAGQRKYLWQVDNLAAVVGERFGPSRDFIIPQVQITPYQFKFDDFVGDMSSWEAYSRSMYELNKGRDVLSPAMRNTVKELTASAETTREKIDTLYRYLQENMRYVSVQLGIGGWQTFDAAYVEKNKYGDCKALSNFMKALLKEADIPAYQALIYSDDQKLHYDEGFVNPRFNHVVLYVPQEGYWLECTSNAYPPNYLGRQSEDRKVLLVKATEGKLIKTPALGATGNRRLSQVKVNLKADGNAKVNHTLIGKGSSQDALRYFSGLGKKDQRTYLRRYDYLPNGNLSSLVIEADYNRPSTRLEYEMEVPHYAAKAGRRLFIPVNPFNAFDKGIAQQGDRNYAIIIDDHFAEEDVYIINFPVGYELENQPREFEPLESPFGRYELEVRVKDQQLVCTRQLEIKPVEVPAERFEEVREFYNQIIKKDKLKLVLVKKKT